MSNKYFPQPSVTDHQAHFAQVPSAEIPRSRFDRSHGYKTTFDAGLLCSIFVDEVLPGDTFTLNQTSFARLATPLKPIMDNIKLDTHFFFVPNRLVWEHWQEFMGERANPDDDPTEYVMPKALINLKAMLPGDLAAYFGLPMNPLASNTPVEVSALPFRAYALIWNEWYRDQNLQDRIPVPLGDGPDTMWNGTIPKRRGKRHDYFTSCLPWPQKGDPVHIPLGTSAPLAGNLTVNVTATGRINDVYSAATGGSFLGNITQTGGGSLNQPLLMSGNDNPAGKRFLGAPNSSGVNALGGQPVYADLSAATAVTINDLRTAFQIQRLLERDARGGTRYIELILSHFGVRSDDARLQRPEYLGGGSSPVNINPVASTAQTTSLPQANLSGVGTSVNRSGFQKAFTEHGFIIGVVSARADLTYQQGIERFWSRETRYDHYWPALAHLGEQAVLNKEICAWSEAEDEDVFGYQERYAEYRYKPSRVTGLFSSGAAASLDVWHLAQEFGATPALNDSFIQDNPPIDRVIAVPSEPHFLLDVWFSLQCDRPMPVYSVPGLIDHF